MKILKHFRDDPAVMTLIGNADSNVVKWCPPKDISVKDIALAHLVLTIHKSGKISVIKSRYA